jgi:hypothetical protein
VLRRSKKRPKKTNTDDESDEQTVETHQRKDLKMSTRQMLRRLAKVEHRVRPKRDDSGFTLEELCLGQSGETTRKGFGRWPVNTAVFDISFGNSSWKVISRIHSRASVWQRHQDDEPKSESTPAPP